MKRSKRAKPTIVGTKYVVQIGRTPHGQYTNRFPTWPLAQQHMLKVIGSVIDPRLKHDPVDYKEVDALRAHVGSMTALPEKQVVHGYFDRANKRDIYLVVWTEQ